MTPSSKNKVKKMFLLIGLWNKFLECCW